MSEHENEQNEPAPPSVGDEAPPSVEPISAPESDDPPPEPIGRTPEAESGEPPSDEDLGVGVAPTQPGDAGEGNPGTAFQTTEQIENAGSDDDDTAKAI